MTKTIYLLLLSGLFTASGLFAADNAPVQKPADAADLNRTFFEIRRDIRQHQGLMMDFVQKTKDSVLSDLDTTKGTLTLARPAQMSWEYTEGQKQILILNEKRVWLHLPDDKQVYTETLASTNYDSLVKALLGDDERLQEVFKLHFSKDGKLHSVTMTPVEPIAQTQKVVLHWQPEATWFEGCELHSSDNTAQVFTFSNHSWIEKVDKALFKFTPPKKCEIMDFEGNTLSRKDVK